MWDSSATRISQSSATTGNKKYQNAKNGSSLGLGTHSLRVGFTNLKFSNNAIILMQSYIVKVY